MSRAFRASVLILILTSSAQAGWIQNGSSAAPPPPSITAEEATMDGEIQNPLTVEETTAGTFLTIVTSVLALF